MGNMLVVDSSVFIDYLNGRSTPAADRLTASLDHDSVLLGDVVLCEILKGARTEAQARMLALKLREFELVRMVDKGVVIAAAANYRSLRAKGYTIRNTIDLIIGAYCILNHHTLLHADRDFDPMETILGLKVMSATYEVREPAAAYG